MAYKFAFRIKSLQENKWDKRAKSSKTFKHNQSLQSRAIYLNKLCTVTWKAAFEPQKRNNIANTITRFNNGRHWHTSIAWLLTYKAIKTYDMKP